MTPTLDWPTDGRAWPHREASSFVVAGGLRWHVQRMGTGPVALLLHGTGAATHSWRGLMPLLAARFSVVAVDLPGHGFTDTPGPTQFALPAMAGLVGALVAALGPTPQLIVGHSAGAAIAARMALDGACGGATQVAINGAFLPLAGLPGLLFPPVARLMAATPLAAHLFARRDWDAAAVDRLIRGTGSRLDAQGIALYGLLMRDPTHAAAALAMMARWDLRPMARDLGRLPARLASIVGTTDRAVPPSDAARVQDRLPVAARGGVVRIAGAGHLVHEEQPGEVARAILSAVEG